MTPQLLLIKRLATESTQFAKRVDPISSGIAISLLQDAVELYVWTTLKEKGLAVKDQSSFTANLEALEKAGFAMPQVAKLLELNKARVNFKHYGNLPAPGEAVKFETYAIDCLTQAARDHFGIDFEQLSLVDLVAFPDVKAHLKAAETHIAADELADAAKEASIARGLLFGKLDKYLPHVDHNLKDTDRILNSIEGVQGVNPFHYLTDYLDGVRQLVMLSLARVPLETAILFRNVLPPATQFEAGNWRVRSQRAVHDKAHLTEVVRALVDISSRIQELVR
ncbi:MAG: hypothetical protein C4535_13470 [Comamonadaceae bacterium]|nr:MAG: hypothetical protein C4535_13470 [Comamonadaceae bacterium]